MAFFFFFLLFAQLHAPRPFRVRFDNNASPPPLLSLLSLLFASLYSPTSAPQQLDFITTSFNTYKPTSWNLGRAKYICLNSEKQVFSSIQVQLERESQQSRDVARREAAGKLLTQVSGRCIPPRTFVAI